MNVKIVDNWGKFFLKKTKDYRNDFSSTKYKITLFIDLFVVIQKVIVRKRFSKKFDSWSWTCVDVVELIWSNVVWSLEFDLLILSRLDAYAWFEEAKHVTFLKFDSWSKEAKYVTFLKFEFWKKDCIFKEVQSLRVVDFRS